MPITEKYINVYIHATDVETLSISILQAMSAGLPILASDVDGISNLLYQEARFGSCVANDEGSFAK